MAKETPDHEGPFHPVYSKFHLRRSLRRICHYYHHPSQPHRRFEEIIDVIAIPSVMASSSQSTTVWEDNSPETLFIIASKCILANPGVLFRIVEDEEPMHEDFHKPQAFFDQVHDGIVLPLEICDHLLQTMVAEGLDIDDRVAKAFSDPYRSKLRRLDLKNTNITNSGFNHLVKHNLRELRMHNCLYLTDDILSELNSHSHNLVELSIEPAAGVLPAYLPSLKDDLEDEDEMYEEDKLKAQKYFDKGYIINGPRLQRLTLRDMEVCLGSNYFEFLLRPLPQLTHLDLSGATHRDGHGDFEFLLVLQNLKSLVLHDVPGITQSALVTISKLKLLRHLDISQMNKRQGRYEFANVSLRNLVQELPELTSLDISGTNLAGTGTYDDLKGLGIVRCDIPGLVSRVDKPLDFLGLYKTEHEASLRAHIPAKEISGEVIESHMLSAAKRYFHRSEVLDSVLAGFYHKVRTEEGQEDCQDIWSIFDVVLMAMERYTDTKKIQYSCTASLYFIVKLNISSAMNLKMKRKILSTLLNVMYAHRHDTVVVRNSCLILCQFELPHDVKFEYEKLVKILLFIISEHTSEDGAFVQRASICLLNSLACQVEGKQKLLVGDLGAMEKMLDVIKSKLQSETCDEVMETAWSTMWNVTDETPINCKRFLDGGGMDLFLHCKERFPNKNDLLRNMMGLLGNVAEVEDLRPDLMTKDFVAEFLMLVDSTSDGIETSYNAAGVLAHMASDGAEVWKIAEPTRTEVLERMVVALDRWDINTKRNINYRSFEPILRLVKVVHTPQCQHWAAWALANLTRTDDKYCELIVQEGGLFLLEELINSNTSPAPYSKILELASIVRENVNAWRDKRSQRNGNGNVVEDYEALDLDG